MKKRVLLFLSLLFVWGASLLAQDVPEGVVTAFKKGSSQELRCFLGDKVDFLFNSRIVSSERDATLNRLSDFFTEHKVNNFSVHHQGKRNESSFFIGTLTTTHGNLRVNCFFKMVQNRYIVHQIRLDKTND